jgi:glycosyltransferase involved in cell wall biosynthesis
MTAIRAMQLLGPDARVSLVCTGATEDYRRPGYLQEIQQSIAERGLVGSVHVLGHIPKRDHIEIMKGALAVVQPTLFEGGPGGGSVADALALGVPVLLSDIPVNREVAGDNVFFFRPTDAGELASLMTRVSGGEIARPPRDVLEARAEEHLSRLGDSLMTAIDVAIDSHGPVARGRC